MRLAKLLILMGLVVLLAAACGTAATPVPNAETREALAAAEEQHSENVQEPDGQEVAVEPTATSVPPTETPLPPTPTPTEIPATEAPTEAPTATVDPIVVLVNRLGDPAHGETLFIEPHDTAAGTWMCTQCHNNASEDRLIGPGLLNLRDRAGSRIEGVPAEIYVFNSIIHPNDFIVPAPEGDPEYPADIMPQNYREIFSDQDLYDLVAYLLSLQG